MEGKVLRGKWKQIKSKAQKQWASMMFEDMDLIEPVKEKQIGKFNKRYAYSAEAVERDYREWYSRK